MNSKHTTLLWCKNNGVLVTVFNKITKEWQGKNYISIFLVDK